MMIYLLHTGYRYSEKTIFSKDFCIKKPGPNEVIQQELVHIFKKQPVAANRVADDDLIVNEVGWEGDIVHRDYNEFSKFSGKKMIKRHSISVSQKTGE